MKNTEKKLLDKYEEYNRYLYNKLKNAAGSYFAGLTESTCNRMQSELSQLKSDLAKEKEEQGMSAKDVLTKWSDGHYTQFKGYENILSAMHDFKNKGKDWEKIEEEFRQWVSDNYYSYTTFPTEIFNWFKNNL